MKKEFNFFEKMAIYLAKNSVGRSVPTFVYEVEKPEGLEEMIENLTMIRENNDIK